MKTEAPPRDRTDAYPSRVDGAGTRITDRLDPTVWGDDPGPLTYDQIDRYRRRGHLSLPGVVDRALIDASVEAIEVTGGDDDRLVAEPDDDDTIRSSFAIHETDGPLADLVRHPGLVAVARQLLGSDVYVHQSRLNYKPAFRGRGFPWHSDFETWHVEDGMPRMRAVSCSVALTDNLDANGPLLVIDGSHLRFVACPGRTPPGHHETSLRWQQYGVPGHDALSTLAADGQTRALTGPAGTAFFFDSNLMHGSADNITPHRRANAFIVYNSILNALQEPFGTDAPRPSHLATRGTTEELDVL